MFCNFIGCGRVTYTTRTPGKRIRRVLQMSSKKLTRKLRSTTDHVANNKCRQKLSTMLCEYVSESIVICIVTIPALHREIPQGGLITTTKWVLSNFLRAKHREA